MGYFISVIGILFIGYLIGHHDGWVDAHKEVATECKKLGSFYVGREVFKCTEITESD